jgi:hypothetical protein
MIILAIGLIAPVADSFLRSRGQGGISAESANLRDGTIFGYQDFENYIAGAVSGAGLSGILGLGAGQEKGIGRGRGDPYLRGSADRGRG